MAGSGLTHGLTMTLQTQGLGQQPIAALAEFAATAVGAPHHERLALHIADGVLALLAGQATCEGRALSRFHERHERSALSLAALNAALMRHTELDDIHRPTAVTATAIALPALLPWASAATAERFIDAFYVGQEVAVRAAHAMGGAQLMGKGLWPSYLVAPLGAAAATGRLLGLSTSRMQHALAMALAHTPRAPGKSTGARPGRWLMFGQAVRAGCMAALAAQDGMDGDPAYLCDETLASIGGIDARDATADAGAVIDALSIKPHCAAKQALAAIEAMQRVLALGVDPASIDKVELFVPTAYAAMLQREPACAGRLASMVNAGWQLALVARAPAALDDADRSPTPADCAVAAFAERVSVHADTALDALYPAHWPARLVVSARGERHEVLVTDSPGDPAMPFDAGQLLDKACRVLGPSTVDPASGVACVARALELHAQPVVVCELASRFARPASPNQSQQETLHANR